MIILNLLDVLLIVKIAPHVQSYLWALDFESLDFLLEESVVLKCHETKYTAIINGELGASKIFLDSGYATDSLMTKYHGVDF